MILYTIEYLFTIEEYEVVILECIVETTKSYMRYVLKQLI